MSINIQIIRNKITIIKNLYKFIFIQYKDKNFLENRGNCCSCNQCI